MPNHPTARLGGPLAAASHAGSCGHWGTHGLNVTLVHVHFLFFLLESAPSRKAGWGLSLPIAFYPPTIPRPNLSCKIKIILSLRNR